MSIPFNKPYLTGKELEYIRQAIDNGKLSGNGLFTQKCQSFLEKRYSFRKVLLTASCTDALEMAALLINACPDDEIIIPSYSFVSTANPFILRGSKIVFADSTPENPNIDAGKIEQLITPKTKAIVVVHYAGIACDMDAIMQLADKYNLFVIEDAAQCIDSFYKSKPLGGIGHLAAFSFHETKNIMAGEGGMLVINDEQFLKRAEIIWEKGTNRAEFFRGETDKYNWVDIGSSFLPSEVTAAFLYAQLENIDRIQQRRIEIWNKYNMGLSFLKEKGIRLPVIPAYATNNAHIYYLICNSYEERNRLIDLLIQNDILAIFHYLPLHLSPFFKDSYVGEPLLNVQHYADCLLRLPLFYELSNNEVDKIVGLIKMFYK